MTAPTVAGPAVARPAATATLAAAWSRWSRRVDALSVRERVFVFISIAAVLVAATDALVLSPRAAEQKALAMRLRAQSTEIGTLRQQVAAADPAADSPGARLQHALREAEREQAEIDATIAQRVGGPDGARLGPLLATVLRRHERLALLKLATGDTIVARTGSPPLQGVEFAVRGSYADLAGYLADLEKTLPGLRWEELAIQRQDSGTELRARVALLGERR